jgi:hypothetical protein
MIVFDTLDGECLHGDSSNENGKATLSHSVAILACHGLIAMATKKHQSMPWLRR